MIGTGSSHENKSVRIFREIAQHAKDFFLVFVLIFALSFFFLWMLGATPTTPEAKGETIGADVAANVSGEVPLRVSAPSIGLDAEIENPGSRDLSVLDRALEKGAVYYPGSALLGERGNTLLFGHSSYLRVVGNSAYRTFNDIQKLKVDELVSVYSTGREYRYRVTSVRFVKAEEGVIDLRPGAPRLTLVTCDSFRTKSDRFVVEAELVGTYPSA